MPVKGNNFRTNTLRNEDEGKGASYRPSNKSKSPRDGKKREKSIPSVTTAKLIKVAGLFFLVLSLYFLVAFTSYLFTWQIDQSYVSESNGGWSNLTKSREELEALGIDNPVVQNWLGKFGALLAHQFIYKWFGVASFLFIGVFFIIGYRLLFKVKLVALDRTFAYGFFLLLYISLTIGFFHGIVNNYPHFMEGEFGFWSNRLLQAQIGRTGVAGFLIFAGLTALVIAFNVDFKLPERKKRIKLYGDGEQALEDDESMDEDENQEEGDFRFNRIKVPERPMAADGGRLSQQLDVKAPQQQDQDKTAENKGLELELEKTDGREVSFAKNEIKETPAKKEELTFEVEESVPDEPLTLTVEQVKEEKPVDKAASLVEEFGPYDPKLDLSGYRYPTLDLLKDYGSGKIMVNNSELEANKDKIVETLANYNIEIDKIKATIGPTVTLYEIIPKPGVRISKIKNLEDDIALSLAALGIRIIAPMPGKGTIGIEVPNTKPEMVSMRSVIATEKFQNTDMDLPIALGKTISNEVYIADLAKMPHLLVAGATGQGKSVGINAILTSLLYKRHPAELKFVLVDPKKVELSLFKTIERHFLAKLPGEDDAIITDTKKVINTLNSLCIEMDQRYDLLKNAGVRNLREYNAKFVNRRLNPEEGHRFLPFIVLIVDEFADLMMTAGKEVETPIARLAQLARAVGIHLVIATQRPSVNIITGTIKANFPARLAFRVLSKIDSRTILDTGGADQLIGRGDMLLATGSDLIRIQCAFVDTPEVEEISEFIGNQRGYPSAFMLPEYVDENGEGSGAADVDLVNDRDALFEDAARLIVMHQQGSTSLIQRKLKLGYNRAGRIIDQLEAAGIVGPFEGSKARDVLYPDEYSLEQYLDTLNNGGKD
ncbi:FtsK/SpoIIIE family DNA translocase [Olivibacter sitiensis]|uniref:FtsK/SpoIIIE family DNA translocase n=1 Tax=Olivibacter sitiensis TaxID=376470 RepID=UPI000408732D|nr:DNA translocase FtsK [Olivibacter sitiensis]